MIIIYNIKIIQVCRQTHVSSHMGDILKAEKDKALYLTLKSRSQVNSKVTNGKPILDFLYMCSIVTNFLAAILRP